MIHGRGAAIGLLAALALACPGPEPAVDAPLRFDEVAAAVGLEFVHDSGARGSFYYPELLQPGAAFVDVDNDGLLDVYLVQSGAFPFEERTTGSSRLFRNTGDGRFEDVSAAAGVAFDDYGAGVAAADYDADGDVDLYLTNLGPNRLLRNDGDGRFVAFEAGVEDDGYGTAASFADIDADGDLDLFVANYLDWSRAIERDCFTPAGLRDYCSPGAYRRPAVDRLFRNDGDGTFTDITEVSGIGSLAGHGLGAALADFDGDGDVDIFVANDQMDNFLWINDGSGRFRDEAVVRGCAVNESGRAEASMGTAIVDEGDDGDWDLWMVHLDGETNTFYRNDGSGYFADMTELHGLGAVSRPYTGFGTHFADFDCDGRDDLFIANGRVRLGDTMEPGRYQEPNQWLLGRDDGRFTPVARETLQLGHGIEISRGSAVGDYDNDGDIDLLVANNDGPPRLYRNESCGGRHWIGIELRPAGRDRDGLGAVVTLVVDGQRRNKRVESATGYLSSSDPRVHFGLGDVDSIDAVEIRWPDGRLESFSAPPVDRWTTLP